MDMTDIEIIEQLFDEIDRIQHIDENIWIVKPEE